MLALLPALALCLPACDSPIAADETACPDTPLVSTIYLDVTEGREIRTVEVDPERAHLVTWAFNTYASGDWSVRSLTDELIKRGLIMGNTAKLPAQPVETRQVHQILTNPYYLGIVSYKGAQYSYYTCLGRHSKRTDCALRSINYYHAEDLIQEMYDRLALKPKCATTLRSTLTEQLQLLKNDTAVQAEALASQELKIERRQRKLLEAHYNDAIPIAMLGTEQKRLDAELTRVNRELKDLTADLGDAARFIEMAIDLAEQSAGAYSRAPEHICSQFN